MSLKRYTQKVDGTIPIQALLYEDEVLLASQEGVGIYDGPQKSAPHQCGTAHATTHRLFYIDVTHPHSRSFALDLAHVSRTDYYAGLFTSSSKVTLYLSSLPHGSASALNSSSNVAEPLMSPGPPTGDPAFDSWECEVCSYRNPPGLSPAASRVCALCGVPRSSIKAPISIAAKLSTSSALHPLSSSLPSSSLNLGKMSISSSSSPLSFSPAPGSGAGSSEEIACPACTFLNHPSLPACEICGTSLPRKPHPPAKSAPTSRPVSPMISGEAEDDATYTPEKRMIRISFRKGGDKSFYNLLRRSLLGKGWEAKDARRTPQANVSAGSRTTGRSGINGILRNVESTAATSQTNMEDALQDLEALMVKWKDMVQLAQDLNERLTAVSASATSSTLTPSSSTTGVGGTTVAMTTQAVEPEEATFIRSSLAQLGLQMTNAPVTLDMIRDERKWIEELARELAGVLQGGGGKVKGEGMMRKRGIVGLDEVWGGWNRARGVALIPPSTFLLVLPQLPYFTRPPIHMRTFSASGLSVLHTPPYTRISFAARLVGLLHLTGPRTTVEIAQEEDLPIALTEEMVTEVESEGEVCRDESGSGVGVSNAALSTGAKGSWAIAGAGEVRWWVNIFRGYIWDGQM